MRWRSCTLVGALILAGCAGPAPPGVLPPAVPALPTAWDGLAPGLAAPATPLAQWWQRFNDPLLTDLVTQALQANPNIHAARASLRQARALRDVAAAALSPGLAGNATAQRSANGSQSGTNTFRLGLDASWELDVFGANRQGLNAGEATLVASAASLGEVQVSLAAEVALALITLRSGQARLAIANDNLASQLHTLQITEWRLQAGLVGALDAQQARAAAEQTRALLPALQSAITQSRHALAVLCGQPPAALVAQLLGVGTPPRAPDDLVLAIPADTLRQRADVRAAEWRVRAAQAQVAQADAARWPQFNLGGTLGLGAATLGALGDGASVTRSLLASLALPLFDAGAARARVRSQQAATDQAAQAWRATVLVALQEVEDTLAALQADRERSLRLANAERAAAQAARLAQQSYQSGLVDYQSVLETQRNLLGTQDSLATAQATFSADQVRLYKALGGGWGDAALASTLAATAPVATAPSAPLALQNTLP